jgi:serine O-acetyltransferase
VIGLTTFRRVIRELREDLTAAQQRDPAARDVSRLEILLTYGGVQAVLGHRVSHALHEAGVPLLPRVLANVMKVVTGVEIHPAARIGRGLFIDHGAGVVIGETAELGDDVTMYQGVTLGGTGFAQGKRHPTVGDQVTIGSGAKLLGPIVVGERSKVGANSVVKPRAPGACGRQAARGPGRRLGASAGSRGGRDQRARQPHHGARGAARRADRPQARRRGAAADAPPRARLGRRVTPP